MIPRTHLPHMIEYVEALNETLREKGHKPLSKIQGSFLCFVLMGMLLTQSLCWAKLERASGGRNPRWSTEQDVLSWSQVLGLSTYCQCSDHHEAIQDYFAEFWLWTILVAEGAAKLSEVAPRTQPESGALIRQCSKGQGYFTTHRILYF